MSKIGDEEENAAELKLGDDFLKAKCLMNAEVAILLEHRFEQIKQMSEDAASQVPQVFEKTLQYAKRCSRFKSQDAVKQAREVLSRCQLTEFELAVLGNFCPLRVEEAFAAVPSIQAKGRGFDDETITKLLDDLQNIIQFD